MSIASRSRTGTRSPSAHLPAPLDCLDDLIPALAECTGDDEETVVARLIEEVSNSGINVRREFEAWGLKPHVWSSRLGDFYRESQAFAYESTVWNRTPLKQAVRRWMGKTLVCLLPPASRLVIHGDGLGFDGVFAARLGFEVTVIEPSEACCQFARRAALETGVHLQHAADLRDLDTRSFDAVISLDVLEHVPDPPSTVRELVGLLGPDGLFVASAPFFCIEPNRPTHLKSNLRYCGDLGLFTSAGLTPLCARAGWAPIAFRKSSQTSPTCPLPISLWRPLLKAGRWLSPMYARMARGLHGVDRQWLRELEERAALRTDWKPLPTLAAS